MLVSVVSLLALGSALATLEPRDQYPQIIAHRGASGYVPEHSLQAYQLAIDLKTDYIEPDLCLSKDG
jgi:glycerophosphoryl diester phosphodiesterase